MIFGLEFNEETEMPEQMRLYFDQLEDAREEDLEYIQTKAEKIAGKTEEIDALINAHTKGWKTSRMNHLKAGRL